MEIRDALASLRILVQPADDLAFERIMNKPKRGLGDATLQALYKAARAGNIPLTLAARRLVDTDELRPAARRRSEEHTSELQSLMRISYAVFCLKKKNKETRHKSK